MNHNPATLIANDRATTWAEQPKPPKPKKPKPAPPPEPAPEPVWTGTRGRPMYDDGDR